MFYSKFWQNTLLQLCEKYARIRVFSDRIFLALPCRNQSIDLHSKSLDWFLYGWDGKKTDPRKSYSGIFNTFCPTRNVFSRNRCRAKLKGLTENCFFAHFFRSFPIESYTQTASPVFVGQFQLSGGESNNIFLYNCCLMYLAESRVKFM